MFRRDILFCSQMSVKNIHLRFEDDILFPGHSCGLIWDTLIIKPSSEFWEFDWPSETKSNEFSLGPPKTQATQHSRPRSGHLSVDDLGTTVDGAPLSISLSGGDCGAGTQENDGHMLPPSIAREWKSVDLKYVGTMRDFLIVTLSY